MRTHENRLPNQLKAPSPCSAFNDQCHAFFSKQYSAMNLNDETDFIRFEAMATVETFLHLIGVMGKLNSNNNNNI